MCLSIKKKLTSLNKELKYRFFQLLYQYTSKKILVLAPSTYILLPPRDWFCDFDLSKVQFLVYSTLFTNTFNFLNIKLKNDNEFYLKVLRPGFLMSKGFDSFWLRKNKFSYDVEIISRVFNARLDAGGTFFKIIKWQSFSKKWKVLICPWYF